MDRDYCGYIKLDFKILKLIFEFLCAFEVLKQPTLNGCAWYQSSFHFEQCYGSESERIRAFFC
jgi:hypothetical protein